MVSRAFTLIEALVVIAIIIILSSLLLMGANSFGVGSRKTKTQGILNVVRTGLELVVANQGSRPSPAEHPLAPSREPRPDFARASAADAPCSPTGMALRGAPMLQIAAAARPRVLLDDDRFADPSVPQVFGVARGRLSILGAVVSRVTLYRKLPRTITTTADPDQSGIAVAPEGVNADHGIAIEHVFAVAGTQSELVGLGGLHAVDTGFVHALLDPLRGRTLPSDEPRLLTDTAPADMGESTWSATRVRDGARGWKSVCLPGTRICDGWGREILYSLDDSGAVILESAGNDGCFRFDPGANGVLDTSDPFAAVPAGDDRDGEHDNLVSRPGG